ncbi:ABC transporter substrate-binding protein [Cohnella terricola]|uniref:ABC transporter substrate-binding protein n=1 Tax=Cohnella terricola TaxID=1289167 RepID=A0A559JIQ5_9BACL|nr:ABC transporter substrate-binding protein [Cohnella terricola]TVX99754.1 ABC transporter substrate-binding protein [Cohnella terricola]
MRHQRNTYGVLAILLLVVAVLAACGKNDISPSTSGTAQSSVSPSSAPSESGSEAEGDTRVYKDGLGREVVIPAHPQRVITSQYLPQMIALDVKPVGAASHLLTSFVSIKDQIGGIEDVGPANELNLEKALTLEPDLIIVAEWNEDKLDQISKIAPTVVVRWEGKDPFQHLQDVADLLGKTEAAEQWTQAFHKKSEEARVKLAEFVKDGETFGAVVIGGYEKGQLRVYGPGNVGYTLFETLRFPMTDYVKEEWEKGNNSQGLSISMEKLPEFASADRLFLVKFGNDPDFVNEIEKSRLWKDLPAVKNDKVYVVDDKLWFSYDIMSFSAQLEDAVRLLSN